MKNATQKTVELGATRFRLMGKRWYDRPNGNTYHTVNVSALVGNTWEPIGNVPYSHGYGDEYIQSGVDWLIHNGYLSASESYGVGMPSHYEPEFRDNNNIDTYVTDVKRKQDIKPRA